MAQGRDPGRDHGGHGLAGAQRARLPLDRLQEARAEDRVHLDRSGRADLPYREVSAPRSMPPPVGWRLFLWSRAPPLHRWQPHSVASWAADTRSCCTVAKVLLPISFVNRELKVGAEQPLLRQQEAAILKLLGR